MAYTVTIKPRTGWIGVNFRELWQYRELLYIFVWRDIKVRYKQTVIGILWAVLQPFFLMIVFSIFFGQLAKIPSNGVPYPIFVFSGLLFWNYFATALGNSSNSLVDYEGIIKKIYFPRLILPLTPALTPAVDFFIAFVILIGLMIFYHFPLTIAAVLMIFPLIALVFFTAAGLGIFFSSINIKYRDIRFALPFFIQALFFLTPVIYPVSLVPAKYHWLIALNPMSGIVETARSILIGNGSIPFNQLLISFAIAMIFFIFGILYFRRTEQSFADIA